MQLFLRIIIFILCIAASFADFAIATHPELNRCIRVLDWSIDVNGG